MSARFWSHNVERRRGRSPDWPTALALLCVVALAAALLPQVPQVAFSGAGGGGDGSKQVGAVATAADPSYDEGEKFTLSQDLSGYLRVKAKGTVTATVADGLQVINTGETWVDDDGSEHAIKTAFGDDTTSGQNLVVAAVAGNKIVVLDFDINVDGASTLALTSDPLGTPSTISQTVSLAANGGWFGGRRARWFETTSGEALGINVGSTVNTGWWIEYVEDDD